MHPSQHSRALCPGWRPEESLFLFNSIGSLVDENYFNSSILGGPGGQTTEPYGLPQHLSAFDSSPDGVLAPPSRSDLEVSPPWAQNPFGFPPSPAEGPVSSCQYEAWDPAGSAAHAYGPSVLPPPSLAPIFPLPSALFGPSSSVDWSTVPGLDSGIEPAVPVAAPGLIHQADWPATALPGGGLVPDWLSAATTSSAALAAQSSPSHLDTSWTDSFAFDPSDTSDVSGASPSNSSSAALLTDEEEDEEGEDEDDEMDEEGDEKSIERELWGDRAATQAPYERIKDMDPASLAIVDRVLLEQRDLNAPYRVIMDKIKHLYAGKDSSLRGRHRILTKRPEQRVRSPVWTANDIRLLREGVQRSRHPSTGKVSWKAVSRYIKDHGGSYEFGLGTCSKKWKRVQARDGG